MNFRELHVTRLDNGWLLQYAHLSSLERKSGVPGDPSTYESVTLNGAIAFGTLVELCDWVQEMGKVRTSRKRAPVEKEAETPVDADKVSEGVPAVPIEDEKASE
jgi:hypothetical protein